MSIIPPTRAPGESVSFRERNAPSMRQFRLCSFGPAADGRLVHIYRGDFPDKKSAIQAAAEYLSETHGVVIHNWWKQVWVRDPGQPISLPSRSLPPISVTKLAGLHEIKAKPGKYRRR